jgi:hypothetical protein
MTNSLLKNLEVIEVVGTEIIPSVPYKPATPPRTTVKSVEVCGFKYSGPGHYVFSTNPQTGQTTGVFVPDAIAGIGGLQGTWACSTETVTTTEPGSPAQPYVPGRSIQHISKRTSYNLGWNSGARSIRFFRTDGWAEFQVRKSVVGVVCGLNFLNDPDDPYTNKTIDYAFYCARGIAWVMKNGVLGAGVGSYTDDTVFRIERMDGGDNISLQKDGDEVFFEATVGTGPAYLEASMYSAGDEVFNPSIEGTGAADTAEQTGTIDASFAPLDGILWNHSGAGVVNASFAPMRALLTQGELAPAYAVAEPSFPGMSMYATSFTGELGQIDASFEPMEMLAADHPYGEIFAEFAPMTGYLTAYEGHNNASIAGINTMLGTIRGAQFLFVKMFSKATATATMASVHMTGAEMFSLTTFGTTWTTSSALQAVMLSLARSGDVMTVPEGDNETWVINLESSGSTNYTNYRFGSYANIAGQPYGANSDGIYLLDGDTDSGVAIRANVSMGKLDFKSAIKKTVTECYLGMSAKGNLFVKVIAEGAEYIYKTRSYSEELQQQRVTFGKGLRTNYVTLEIYNENGADFELDTVEFRVADLTRRI